MLMYMRKAATAILIIAFMLASSLFILEPTNATTTELVVPDDFPSINQAIQKATDGDTVLVMQGTYNETIVIDKAITLKGENTNKTIINGNYCGTVIKIRHDNVTITGLTILFSSEQNSPHRYYVHPPDNYKAYFLRHTGWDEGLSGIHLQNVQYCNITGNVVSDCGLGVWLTGALYNTVSGNIFVRNNNGLVAQTSWSNKIVGNTFLNGGAGVCLPPKNVFKTGLVNDQSSGYNTFVHNNFIGNQIPIESLSFVNTTSNVWNDAAEGNYWDTYNGTDSDSDGIGDEFYKIMAEYFTGNSKDNLWAEQVYGVDNYPLMEPFNTARLFVTPQNASDNQSNEVDLTKIGIIFLIVITVTIAGLIIFQKKRAHKTNHNLKAPKSM
jgi:parallel beta-helix repeat protein